MSDPCMYMFRCHFVPKKCQSCSYPKTVEPTKPLDDLERSDDSDGILKPVTMFIISDKYKLNEMTL